MEPRDLAAQLRCPAGTAAPRVARQMNESNGSLNRNCISLLGIQGNDRILEIGPGNGAFVPEIVNASPDIRYTGLDLSPDMVEEAGRLNHALVACGQAEFLQGSSDAIPCGTATFDKALTTHTLYFWDEPHDHLQEIRRVMKPGGLFCIGFADREFMKSLSFVPYGFALYSGVDAEALLSRCGFHVIGRETLRETGRSNTGEIVDKRVHVLLCAAH